MKMAKANETDMEMALKLCSALNALGRGDLPAFDGDDDTGLFDEHDDEQAAMAMRQLLNLADRGSIERVIWGMHILLDPANKLVDPDADTLERHPDDMERHAFEDWFRGEQGAPYESMYSFAWAAWQARAKHQSPCRGVKEGMTIAGNGASELGKLMREQHGKSGPMPHA